MIGRALTFAIVVCALHTPAVAEVYKLKIERGGSCIVARVNVNPQGTARGLLSMGSCNTGQEVNTVLVTEEGDVGVLKMSLPGAPNVCLHPDPNIQNSPRVDLYPCEISTRWEASSFSGHSYRAIKIHPAQSGGKCLAVEGQRPVLAACSGDTDQKWRLCPVNGTCED